jgi:uncharacterized protein
MNAYRRLKARVRVYARSSWLPATLIVGLIILAVVFQRHYQKKEIRDAEHAVKTRPERVLHPEADSLKHCVAAILREQQLGWKAGREGAGPERWTVEVPSRIPIPTLHQQIQDRTAAEGFRLLSSVADPGSGRVELRTGADDTCLLVIVLSRPKAEKAEAGRIAVVIDDFGDRHDAMVESFLALDVPVTFSILPGRRYSGRIARESAQRGHETILHLIMEPLNGSFKDDGYIVLKGMAPAAVRKVVERSLEDVPGAAGVNNHMGSKATQDRATLEPVFQVLSERGLFFVDSYTIASSVAYPVAREMGLRAAKRDVFLDVSNGEESIRGKLRTLARRARRNGSAIGIGHCHRDMLLALQNEVPAIQAEGFRFVLLSELVH